MAVYVDFAIYRKPGGRKNYCHLVADFLDELYRFAEPYRHLQGKAIGGAMNARASVSRS